MRLFGGKMNQKIELDNDFCFEAVTISKSDRGVFITHFNESFCEEYTEITREKAIEIVNILKAFYDIKEEVKE